MYVRQQGDLQPATIDQALKATGQSLSRIAEAGGVVAGILSPFLTVEEAYLLASYLKGLNPSNVLALGPVPREGLDQTFQPDLQKGRTGDTSFVVPRPFTIHAEKCPNRLGVEAVLKHFQGQVIDFATISGRASHGEFRGVYVASDAIEPAFSEEDVRKLRPKVEFLVVQDTQVTDLAQAADVVLAGATFAEKAGSYVNADGRLQYAEASLPPRDGSLPDLDLLAILIGRSAGPVQSREILAEVAETVPGFAVVDGGRVAPFGAVLGSTDSVGAGVPFRDAWMHPRGAKSVHAGEPRGGKDD